MCLDICFIYKILIRVCAYQVVAVTRLRVTYRDGSALDPRSPIQVLTGPGVD